MTEPASTFPFSERDIAARLKDCVREYWLARGGQSERQKKSGTADAGNRSEVTGGQHLNAFIELLCVVIRSAGYSDTEIRLRAGVELPGYYRPLKKWDVVVVRDGRLCAALEMKSQVGPSFGNNFNNRSEEAIGSSTDFWVAYREGVLGAQQPWIGYFLLVEDAPRSNSPVRLAKAVFEPMPVFRGTSYMQRYAILCRRLVLERNYSSAALIASPRGPTGEYSEPDPTLGFLPFARSLYGHLIGAA